MRTIDMTGRTCGYLSVLAPVVRDGASHVKWLCRCACGNEVAVEGIKLRSGHTKSCGCMRRPAIDRFTEKIAAGENGCWVWTGSRTEGGYGRFYRGQESSDGADLTYSHRWAYEHWVGPIPDGLTVDHLCRNRACANPAHMEIVTRGENARRGDGAQVAAELKRAMRSCSNGHEYTPENTRLNSRGRVCKTCLRDAGTRYLARKRTVA